MTGSKVEAGAGSFWQVGLVAGLQMGQAFRCSSNLGLCSAVSALHIPGHPISLCDEGVSSCLTVIVSYF